MKKIGWILLCICLLAALLTACGCKHEWKQADCGIPKTCALCGETEGKALGHSWKDADCENPETCTVCGKTANVPLGHQWIKATHENPKTCSACKKTEGTRIIDEKFNVEMCRALFGTWRYEDVESGDIWVLIFTEDARMISFDNSDLGKTYDYYVSVDGIHYAEKWEDNMTILAFSLEDRKLKITAGIQKLEFERYSDSIEPKLSDERFDKEKAELIGKWRVPQLQGQVGSTVVTFTDAGIMKIGSTISFMNEDLRYVYYIRDGVIYYGRNWYATMQELEYKWEGDHIYWKQDGKTTTLLPFRGPGTTDERFNVEAAEGLIGRWECRYYADTSMIPGMDSYGMDLHFWVTQTFHFREDGSMLVTSFLGHDFLDVYRKITVEKMYREFAAQGFTRSEADMAMLQTYGVDVAGYVDAVMEELEPSDFTIQYERVYYVSEGVIYDAECWSDKMEEVPFTLENGKLTVTDPMLGEALEFNKLP